MFCRNSSEELLHFGDVTGQKSFFQSMLINGFNHRSDQARIFSRDAAKIRIIRMPLQIVINVPHQVDQTFLLRTIDRIIHCIKVRNQNATKFLQKFLNHASFSGIGVDKDDILQTGKDPYLSGLTDQSYFRFIRKHQRSVGYACFQLLDGICV